ncbi:hypothetical protein KI387_040543, partial [Taxus chinensis]
FAHPERHEPPRCLNYLTSPYVVIWSAVTASCAFLGLFQAQELMAEDRHGDMVPYHTPFQVRLEASGVIGTRQWIDSNVITFSPKVFIPLTRACRDFCGYCMFSLPPKSGRKIHMTTEEIVGITSKGEEVGCNEALFTLGDKPELIYLITMNE